MADFFERVDELRSLLGLSQNQFMLKLALRRNVYSMWKSGAQAADRDTAMRIADRWHVSLDSLWGRPGTLHLEPSPALAAAQESLAAELAENDTKGSPRERLVICFQRLTIPTRLPSLSVDAWCDWLRWRPEDWDEAVRGSLEVGEVQVRGAAFFLGWYEGWEPWSRWIRTGTAGELVGVRETAWKRTAEIATRAGLDPVDLRRLIKERATQTPGL